MVYATFASLLAAGLVGSLLVVAHSSNRVAEVDRAGTVARYKADGAVEFASKELVTSIANWETPKPQGVATMGADTVPYTVTPTGFSTVVTENNGIQTLVTGYRIEAVATVDGHSRISSRVVNAEATPVFQFAVFYTDDLEIFPGPSMTLGGRIHSNRDLYIGTGGTLTVNTNYMRAVGDMYRSRKDDPSKSQGTVKIRRWVEDPFDPAEPVDYVNMMSQGQLAGLGMASTSGYDSLFQGYDDNGDLDFDDARDMLPWAPGSLENWSQPTVYSGGTGNTVQNGAHGISEAVTPEIGSIAMFDDDPRGDWEWDPGTSSYKPSTTPGTGTHDRGFYHGEADLKLITYDDGSWKAYNGLDIEVTGSVASAISVGSLYDARQANGSSASIRTLDIDMAALNGSGAFPTNGLLYAAHYGAGTGTQARGIRLENGAELKDALTVVSENSVYVQGDYNTTNKKGAAVIADAVNLLSNSWDNTKTKGNLPSASDTTYNLALVTGNGQTQGSKYNGGLENLPRFHENWSGKKCNIRGSFVNTWGNQYADGAWKYGSDRYTAPSRNWSYDPDFNVVSNLPPYTPMAVTARDIVSW